MKQTSEGVDHIIQYIENHLLDNLDVHVLSKKFFISESYLYLTFKKYTGSTLHSFILTKRMELARTKILKGILPTKVSQDLGFEEYSTFYRQYKKIFRCSPSADSKNKIKDEFL